MVAPVSSSTALEAVSAAAGRAPSTGVAKGGSFAATLEAALKSVSQSQTEATALQRQYQAGVQGVSLEQTMVAMQKAQVGFQAALAVRNRMVSAYSDIMNMQV